LFPWEAHNSFHSMNDNVFSLLASIVLQHVTGRHRPRGEAAMGGKRVLYVFPKQSRAQAKESFMFKLLRVIFDGEVGQGDCFPSLPGLCSGYGVCLCGRCGLPAVSSAAALSVW
jgi:hypothetical protein